MSLETSADVKPGTITSLPKIPSKNLEFLATILLCSSKPFAIDTSQVNFDLVAERCNLKNAATAKVRYYQIKGQLLGPSKANKDKDSNKSTSPLPTSPIKSSPTKPRKTPTTPRAKANKVQKSPAKPRGRKGDMPVAVNPVKIEAMERGIDMQRISMPQEQDEMLYQQVGQATHGHGHSGVIPAGGCYQQQQYYGQMNAMH